MEIFLSTTALCTAISVPSSQQPVDWVRATRLVLKNADRNFHLVRPWIYWRDMFFSTTIAYASAAVFLTAPAFTALQIISFLVAVFWLYRAGSLIHEVAHLGGHEMKSFKISWNLLVGVPTLAPSTFFTNHHRDHHTQRIYGTPLDPEYLINICSRGNLFNLAFYFLVVALFPLLVFLRFLLAPLSFITPQIRDYVLRNLSSFTFNRRYKRSISRIDRKAFASLELLCFVRALCIPAAVLLEFAPWTRMFQLYLLGAAVVTLNQLRQLADHHFEGDGGQMNMSDHIVDSCNYTSHDPLTWLFFPFAIQYHALHHLFPSLPYHNLASAHTYLMQTLSADSPYRALDQPSWWSVAKNMLRQSR